MKKTPSTKKAAPAKKPRAVKAVGKSAAAAKAAPVAASSSNNRKPLSVLLFIVLLVGIVAQGMVLYKKNKRSKMVLNFVNELAPIGRNQPGEFCCVRDFTTDAKGDVYVLEEFEVGNGLQKYSADGKLLGYYKPKKPDQAFQQGYAVAVDSTGDIYVVESSTGMMKVLDSKLNFKRSFEIPSRSVTDLLINDKDELFITDRLKPSIMVIDRKGALLRSMEGHEVGLSSPYRMCWGAKGELYVLDMIQGFTTDPDVKVLSQDGKLLRKWTTRDLPVNSTAHIQYHPKGYLAINDNRGNSLGTGLHFYTPEGKLVGTARQANNAWDFKNVPSFYIDPKRGDIYINTICIGRGGDRFSWDPEESAAK